MCIRKGYANTKVPGERCDRERGGEGKEEKEEAGMGKGGDRKREAREGL